MFHTTWSCRVEHDHVVWNITMSCVHVPHDMVICTTRHGLTMSCVPHISCGTWLCRGRQKHVVDTTTVYRVVHDLVVCVKTISWVHEPCRVYTEEDVVGCRTISCVSSTMSWVQNVPYDIVGAPTTWYGVHTTWYPRYVHTMTTCRGWYDHIVGAVTMSWVS